MFLCNITNNALDAMTRRYAAQPVISAVITGVNGTRVSGRKIRNRVFGTLDCDRGVYVNPEVLII